MKVTQIGAVALLGLMIAVGFLPSQKSARAQDEQPKGNIAARTRGADPDMKGTVMVSMIRDGVIVKQEEVDLGGFAGLNDTPVGTYDIRCEAEGMTTVVKRGLVVAKGQGTNIIVLMSRGPGVKVIQYEPTSATRDELAVRVAKLEASQCNCGKK